jgi:branched-chain amino acid transport system permease protein
MSKLSDSVNRALAPLAGPSWLLSLGGAVIVLGSSLLSWSYSREVLDNVGLTFNPGSLQIFAIVIAVVALFLVLLHRSVVLPKLARVTDTGRALRTLGTWTLVYALLIVAAVAGTTGGLINVDPGAWVLLAGAIVLFVGSRVLPERSFGEILHAKHAPIAEILTIVALMAAGLFIAAYALGLKDGWVFVLFLTLLGALTMSANRAGWLGWLGLVGDRNRKVLILSAFVVAFLFPFTQNGSDANMSIATQVLIFAATAMGLNIVVGLAGLLDLGYIAFLGAGAYVGAMLSTSAFATIGWKPPFLVVAVVGACVSATLGLIIGTPTLRVSGDYLAIVTLAFGEIFRLAMFNLDGNNGPDLTNGPNGIPGIPDMSTGSFSFGDAHTVMGIELGRFANYYFLLLLLIAFIILVFVRLNASRIGRGWVAIREDEKAAEAMGVNVFGLKILAFAGGAFLAGLAGTVKAHQDVSVSPDQYIFLESAFLLAAIVLGGMGTVGGVLVGATILKLMPEKLRFFSEYRLLLFGILLVVMMRFRPEGIIANRRRQLEFHEEDLELAEVIGEEHLIAKEEGA